MKMKTADDITAKIFEAYLKAQQQQIKKENEKNGERKS